MDISSHCRVVPGLQSYCKTYPPKMEHVKKDGYFHQVQSSGYVVVSEHDQALAELQGGLLEEVSFPVAAEDLLQELGVDLGRVLLDQFVQQYPAIRLKHEKNKRFSGYQIFQ